MRPDVAARLAAIGSYTTEQGEGHWAHEFNYVWERLPELRCGWAAFDLVFSFPADSDRIPDEHLFNLWEWYRGGHASHAREFRDEIIALSLGEAYEPSRQLPGRTDDEVRRLVQVATIRVFWDAQDRDDDDHGLDACFRFTPLHPDCHGGMVRTWDVETGKWEYVYRTEEDQRVTSPPRLARDKLGGEGTDWTYNSLLAG